MEEDIVIPTFDQLSRIAPVTTIVIVVLLCGVGITYFLMSKHIKSLETFIEWLKNPNK